MEQANTEDMKDRIANLERKIQKTREELAGLKLELPREEIFDYELAAWDGAKTKLSSLFDGHDELIIVHNMGKGCVYCTLWADGFNGIVGHLENRAGFVVVSPDDPATQKSFAEGRGWKFKMLSGKGSTFIKDMGFQRDGNKYMPGFSTFIKESDDRIFRTAYDYFGPGDPYCGIWHMFELLPHGVNNWSPKYRY